MPAGASLPANSPWPYTSTATVRAARSAIQNSTASRPAPTDSTRAPSSTPASSSRKVAMIDSQFLRSNCQLRSISGRSSWPRARNSGSSKSATSHTFA